MTLEKMKKAELVEKAKDLGLDSDGTKAELISRIEAHESEAESASADPVVEEPIEANESDGPGDLDPDLDSVAFVKKAYQDILGRDADENGLRHYVNALDFHGTIDRQKVIDDLKASDEAKK